MRIVKRAGNPFGASKRPTPVLIISAPPTMRWKAAPPPAVEVRLDLVKKDRIRRAETIIHAWRDLGAAILLTTRRVSDGGCWPNRDEAGRRATLLECATFGVDAVDLETDTLADARFRRAVRARLSPRGVIVASLHRFGRFPAIALLEREAATAIRRGADRFKVAVTVASFDEAACLADWALERSKKKIPITAIAMGAEGSWTRWAMPRLMGGPAYAPAGRTVAPGQIAYDRLKELITAPL